MIRGDAAQPADEHGAEAADGFVGRGGEACGLEGLRGEVAEEVDDEGGGELGDVGGTDLHGRVGAEGDFDGVHPGGIPGILHGFLGGGVVMGMAEVDVSLDDLVEAPCREPSSEQCKCHLWGRRDDMGPRSNKCCWICSKLTPICVTEVIAGEVVLRCRSVDLHVWSNH